MTCVTEHNVLAMIRSIATLNAGDKCKQSSDMQVMVICLKQIITQTKTKIENLNLRGNANSAPKQKYPCHLIDLTTCY